MHHYAGPSNMFSCINYARGCRGRANTPSGRCPDCVVRLPPTIPPACPLPHSRQQRHRLTFDDSRSISVGRLRWPRNRRRMTGKDRKSTWHASSSRFKTNDDAREKARSLACWRGGWGFGACGRFMRRPKKVASCLGCISQRSIPTLCFILSLKQEASSRLETQSKLRKSMSDCEKIS